MTTSPTISVVVADAVGERRGRRGVEAADDVRQRDEEREPDEVLDDADDDRLHEAERARFLGDELRDRRRDERRRDAGRSGW